MAGADNNSAVGPKTNDSGPHQTKMASPTQGFVSQPSGSCATNPRTGGPLFPEDQSDMDDRFGHSGSPYGG